MHLLWSAFLCFYAILKALTVTPAISTYKMVAAICSAVTGFIWLMLDTIYWCISSIVYTAYGLGWGIYNAYDMMLCITPFELESTSKNWRLKRRSNHIYRDNRKNSAAYRGYDSQWAVCFLALCMWCLTKDWTSQSAQLLNWAIPRCMVIVWFMQELYMFFSGQFIFMDRFLNCLELHDSACGRNAPKESYRGAWIGYMAFLAIPFLLATWLFTQCSCDPAWLYYAQHVASLSAEAQLPSVHIPELHVTLAHLA